MNRFVTDPAPTKVPSNMISPPQLATNDDEIGQSSESHIDTGIYSEEQEGLVAHEDEEDFQEEEDNSLKQKLVATHQRQLGKNDHITIKDNDVFIRQANDDGEDGENLNDVNIVIQDGDSKKPSADKTTKVVNYETFESSSEDEFSCGAFESAAQSF